MKKLVVRGIKIFFLLFFLYINKNLSCDCCDECWEKNSPDKKISSKFKEEEEEENNKYLEGLSSNINIVKTIKYDLLTEQKIYKINNKLGEGSFGTVYKIKKINDEKIFALKRIVRKDTNDLKDIQKEIQNMILVRNEKNIVKIFDCYKRKTNSDVTFDIIIEFCKNGNLYSFIKKKNKRDKENLRDKIAYQIINAVHSCHKKKIIHNDLKPQNIFLDKDWNVKLGDFGFSNNPKDGEKYSRIVGSLGYMCYEKIKLEKHDPFKADVYSLGVILYELYTELVYSQDAQITTYQKGEKKWKGLKDDFYTNNNVKSKLNKNLKDKKFKNLKILLTNLLQQFEGNRCGWEAIFKSAFYQELQEQNKGN
jgi:MAP/microtubule affinity-regulating kinase